MPSYCFTALAAVSLLSQYVFAQCTPVDSIKLTAYGYPDGQSDTTSFGCNGATAFQSTTQTPGVAGGAGTYDNPFTLATMEGSTLLTECELVYVPYFKKYYRFQDHCTGCDNQHVDLWMGTDTDGGQAQISCELTVGTSVQTIIKNPPNGLDVDAQNLWDGTCHASEVFPNPDTSSLCSGGSGGGSNPPSSSSAVAPAPPVSSAIPSSAPPVVQQQAQQPTSSAAAPAITGNFKPPGRKAEVANNNFVPPTTLLTVTGNPVASNPVATNEPTGTPLPTTNGVCTTAGAAVCSTDGTQIGICNIDMTVIFMDVAPGTKCKDGGMVFADA